MIKTIKKALPSILAVAILIAGDESRIGTSGGNQVLVPAGARGIAMAGSERVILMVWNQCIGTQQGWRGLLEHLP